MSLTGARPALGIPRAFAARGEQLVRNEADERRLAQLFAADFALVWRSLRRFGVPESTADDAAQHVFLTLSERLHDVEPGRERAFLIAVCARVAANVRRLQERTREVASDTLETEVCGGETPEQVLEQRARRRELDRALAELPFDQRTVFVLFELEGFTLPEIAESLEIPLGTATSRLRRARGRFETYVAERAAGGTRD
jgi:RNA polymerase sigma-70 factor (ECF subfamily)